MQRRASRLTHQANQSRIAVRQREHVAILVRAHNDTAAHRRAIERARQAHRRGPIEVQLERSARLFGVCHQYLGTRQGPWSVSVPYRSNYRRRVMNPLTCIQASGSASSVESCRVSHGLVRLRSFGVVRIDVDSAHDAVAIHDNASRHG
jgi:hypothetical protein